MATEDDSDETKRRARWPGYLVMVLIVFPVFYVLSVGPACAIAILVNEHDTDWLESLYSPLANAAKATGTEKALEAYADWWIEVADSDP